MMKKLVLMVFAVSLIWSAQAVASENNVAVVDIKTAMENTKAYAAGIKRLEALQNKKKKELEAMRKRLTDLDKELQLQSMALSNDRQNAKQQELAQLKKTFDRKLQDASDDLKAEKRKLDSRMIGKFYDVVRDYGKEKGFDLILPKSTTIYVGEGLDITADITNILDTK
ncbi:MAG TPA: OmpH family outer membrane protein [Ghiorsea sp.]|nr:OmpH family outer membrane protein [Ghiorsea sp.]HIP07044.1 OmpH family outer membrane protein [Mariprofundaceae bacterium]